MGDRWIDVTIRFVNEGDTVRVAATFDKVPFEMVLSDPPS